MLLAVASNEGLDAPTDPCRAMIGEAVVPGWPSRLTGVSVDGGREEFFSGEDGRAAYGELDPGGGEKARGECDRGGDGAAGEPDRGGGMGRALPPAGDAGRAETEKTGFGSDGGRQPSSSSPTSRRRSRSWSSGRPRVAYEGEPPPRLLLGDKRSADMSGSSFSASSASVATFLVDGLSGLGLGDLAEPHPPVDVGVPPALPNRTGVPLGDRLTSYSPTTALPKPTPLMPKSLPWQFLQYGWYSWSSSWVGDRSAPHSVHLRQSLWNGLLAGPSTAHESVSAFPSGMGRAKYLVRPRRPTCRRSGSGALRTR